MFWRVKRGSICTVEVQFIKSNTTANFVDLEQTLLNSLETFDLKYSVSKCGEKTLIEASANTGVGIALNFNVP